MNGGFSRPLATWCLPTVLAIASLAGCSAFNPPPLAPPPVVLAPEPASDADAAASAVVAVPASAALPASTGVAEAPDNSVHTLQRIKRFIKRETKPKPPAAPPVAAPTVPQPIIAIVTIPHEQARGLLDSDVQRPDGKVIGRAVDLLVDTNGKPQEVVVNLNGFMGVGDVKTNFPWNQFHFNPAERKAPATLALPPGDTPGAPVRKPGAAPLPLLDSTVQDKTGAKVGRVVDVLLDKQAQPQAIVFDVGNSIGPDRHNIAAVWSAVRLVTKDKSLQLQMDLTDAQIKAAPPYASDQAARVIAPVTAQAVAPPAAASAAVLHNPR